MALQFNPYFTFAGNAREAALFYTEVFGGELKLATFADFQVPVGKEHEDLIMHAEIITDYFNLRISDGAALDPKSRQGTTNMEAAIIGDADDLEQAQIWFERLSAGATKIQPLSQAPWGAYFGSLTDQFGIAWMFNIEG